MIERERTVRSLSITTTPAVKLYGCFSLLYTFDRETNEINKTDRWQQFHARQLMEGRGVSLHFPSLDANFLASSLSRLFSLLGHSIKSGAASRRHSLRCLTHVSLSLHKFLAMAFEREGTDAATRTSVFPCAACGRVRRNDGSTALFSFTILGPKN